jgi:alkylation response protein AidB-like acyl-CoA dehydrogenase
MDFAFNLEEERLKEQVRRLAQQKLAPLAPEVDESEDLSWEVVRLLSQEGLFGYVVPQDYGGKGIRVINLCIIREELSRVCVQADTDFAMSGLGAYPIIFAGSEELKKKFLPPLATGEKLGSFALTEPEAGSDVANIKTQAKLDGDFYILNGVKRFISQAGVAHIYSVFVKTDPQLGSKGISAFVVEEGTPGFSSQKMKLMAAHVIGDLMFNDCRLPKTNMLGKPGEGMRVALSTLDVFRTTVGAAVVGIAQAAFEEALNYAQRRIAFGQPIAQFQATQFKLADIATELQAARLLVYWAAWLKDQGGERVIKEASMAKLFATEVANRIVDEALQIHGGAGVVKGVPIERLFREVRATRIYEGTSEIQRLTIARQLLREEK